MIPRWKKQERKTARRYGGRTSPGSGNKWGWRGDVKTDIFLIDDKTTDKKSFSIPQKMWEKIRSEALKEQRRPALKITFANGTSFVCIDESDLYDLVGAINENSKM